MTPARTALALLAIALGMGAMFLGVGIRSATLDPVAARERAAALWSDAGGRPEDCAARRTEAGVEVICDGAAERAVYLLRRDGTLEPVED